MLYNFSNISLFNLILDYSALLNENDIIVLDKSVIYRLNYPEDQEILYQLLSFSKSAKIGIICCCKIIFEDIYNAAIVIDKGKLIGITKQIIVEQNYKCGDSVDLYYLNNKKYLIILNEDIFIPNILFKAYSLKPDYILHINQDDYSVQKSILIAAMSVKNHIKAYAFFNDSAFFYDKNGAVKQIEIGCIRRMKSLKIS